jgi:D-glycero-D-manno-heptose 1,7-bisphosphate phosphatase
MLYMAQRDLSLNLSDCVLFGDDDRGIAAADAARVEYHLVSEEYSLINAVKDWLTK